MEHSFDFELAQPPVLNENMLRRELERRSERRKVWLLLLAALVWVAAAVIAGVSWLGSAPLLAFACLGYAVLTLAAGTTATVLRLVRGRGSA